MAQSRVHKLWFHPRIELLEDRRVLFANAIHKDLTIEGLPFIKDDVMDDINDEHTFQEIAGFLASEEHFDNCNFSGSATEINENYDDALVQADPNDFDDEDITDQFGQMLHGAQDFYAHSNWVDLGQSTVVDRGLGKWIAMTPYTIRNGVMFVQGENETPNVPPFGQATLSRNGHVVTVSFPGGVSFRGVISGTFGLVDDCADNIADSHGDLNKDDASKTLHPQARLLAVQQTEHEFRRFCHLINDQYGQPGVDKFLEEWVKPDATSRAMAQGLCTSNFPVTVPFFEDINPNKSDLYESDPVVNRNAGAGGRINGLANVPLSDIFFAASEWGGLYKTADGGKTWEYLPGHRPQATWDVEVDAEAGKIYATSFYDGRVNSSSGIQVSGDGGFSWSHPASATPQAGLCKLEANGMDARRSEPSAFGIGLAPLKPQNVFVGTNCGVAISNDAGATWKFVDPTPPGAGAAPDAVDVWDVVAQCGGDLRSFCGNNPAVFGSQGGVAFQNDLVNQKVFQWRSFDPVLQAVDTGGFVAATKWNYFPGNPARLVFEGTRGGAQFFGNVLFEPYSRAVVDVVKAGKRVRYLLTPGPVDICGDEGHFRSVDGGNTWTPQNLNLPAEARGRCSIAASPDERDVLFVVGQNGAADARGFRKNDVFESDDGGGTWARLGNPAVVNRVPFVTTNQRSDSGGVQRFDLWFGDEQLFRTGCINPPPAGRTTRCPTAASWSNQQQRAHFDAGDLAFDSSKTMDAAPRIYSNDGGINYYDGNSVENPVWNQPNVAPHALWLYGMDGADQVGNESEDLYFGTQDNGFWAARNAGKASNPGATPPDPGPTWSQRFIGDGFDIAAETNRVVFQLGSSLVRADAGGTGATVIASPPGTIPTFNFPDFIDRFGNGMYVAVTDQGAFFTNDVNANPVVWTRIGPAAGSPGASPGFCAVQAAVSGGTPTFYAQTNCIRVFETDGPSQLWKHTGTGGNAWEQVDSNIPGGGGIGIFAVNPNNPMRLYASQLPAAGNPRMVSSTDGGVTWKTPATDTGLNRLNNLMDGGGPDEDGVVAFKYKTQRGPTSFVTFPGTGFNGYAQPSLIAFDPDTRSNNIIAGGRDSGIFLSTDGGTTWQLLTDPVNPSSVKPHLPRPWFAYFDHEPADKLKIYVGTQGRGVWRITVDVPAPLHLAGQTGGSQFGNETEALTLDRLTPIVEQAFAQWIASGIGVDPGPTSTTTPGSLNEAAGHSDTLKSFPRGIRIEGTQPAAFYGSRRLAALMEQVNRRRILDLPGLFDAALMDPKPVHDDDLDALIRPLVWDRFSGKRGFLETKS